MGKWKIGKIKQKQKKQCEIKQCVQWKQKQGIQFEKKMKKQKKMKNERQSMIKKKECELDEKKDETCEKNGRKTRIVGQTQSKGMKKNWLIKIM